MGDVLAFRQKVSDEDVVLCDGHGQPSVALSPEGRVVLADDTDAASRALWDAVEDRVREVWQTTTIPRLQAQVRLLARTLDEEVPDWRERVKRRAT